MVTAIIIVIILLAVAVAVRLPQTSKQAGISTPTPLYTKKKLETDPEIELERQLLDILGGQYVLRSQVNLATIIDKNAGGYRNELFRNVDFGVFDASGNILILIELNDSSHNSGRRRYRDYKVREICEEAGIPLIFLRRVRNEDWYIRQELRKYIDLP